MEELGALIKISTDANKTNIGSISESEDLLNAFGDYFDTNSNRSDKGETGVDQEGDNFEEDEIVIGIPETLSEDANGKIRKYHGEILAGKAEIVSFQEVWNELSDRLKKTHKYRPFEEAEKDLSICQKEIWQRFGIKNV